MLDKLILKDENRERTAFYASDFGKPSLDLYFAFTNEPKTNPAKWYESLKWGAGRGVEEQMGIILKQSGIVPDNYDQKEHGRIEIAKFGIKIHGYIDFKSVNGTPIECKSINNKNEFDIGKYERGYPRENYVGQLATYMYHENKDIGYLFVASVDGLNYFWFECKKIGDGVYKCGNVTVDLFKEWRRWAELYENHIVPRLIPDVFEYKYKYPVDTLDWKAQSKAAITKARTGKAVIGDWQVQWSGWKDKIVELQGTTLGYTNDELAIILEKTKGYTTWKK